MNNMYIPFDEELQIHLEYDGYNGHVCLNRFISMSTTYRCFEQMINQADVALLQYPLGYPMSKQIAHNDLVYWQNKTNPDGYFTGDRYIYKGRIWHRDRFLIPCNISAYSIAWLALGELEEAEMQFNKSFQHISSPFNVWQETLTGGQMC